MYEWAWLMNDLMAGYRIGLLRDFLVFALTMLLVWEGFFGASSKLLKGRVEEWARARGYANWADFRFCFTRFAFATIAIFFMVVSTIFFFTHLADIKTTYRAGTCVDLWARCEELGPSYSITCMDFGKSNANPDLNGSTGNFTWLGVEHGPVNQERDADANQD